MATFASSSATSGAYYATLGLTPDATKAEVKEAFIRLCKLHHPDRVAASDRVLAEGRFREIKAAYDEILRGQAGYNVPRPGSAPHPKYTRAYYRAHGMGMEFGEAGPIRCGGPFGGYATETDFYRAMFRTSRNNPVLLLVSGLLSIPFIALTVSMGNGWVAGDVAWIKRFRDEGLHMFSGQIALRVNGRDAIGGINPFAIRSVGELGDSYIFKDPKAAHLRRRMGGMVDQPEADEAAPAPAPAQA